MSVIATHTSSLFHMKKKKEKKPLITSISGGVDLDCEASFLCFFFVYVFFSKDMLTYWSVNTFNFLFIYFIAAPDSQRQIKLSLKLLNVVTKKQP